MATFPTSPSVNDTVTMGDVTYKWNGNGWQVDVGSGGGGGSSEWTDTGGTIHPTETADTVAIGASSGDTNAKLSVDGAGSFKAQSSTPTDTAGYAHFFAKDVVTPATSSEVLFHLDDNLNDSSGSSNNGTAAGNITYATSGAGGSGASGFSKSAVFDGTGDYFTFSDIDIGTSAFTCSFWMKLDSTSASNAIININTGSSGAAGYFSVSIYAGYIKAWYWNGSSTVSDNITLSGAGIGAGTWHHLAYVRGAPNGTSTQHSLYVGDAGDVTGTRVGSWQHTPYVVGGEGDDWNIGRLRDGSLSDYEFDGELDEIIVSKSALYDGTTYTIPTGPYVGQAITTTHIYARNSAGEEALIV